MAYDTLPYITGLPTEVLLLIFSYLPAKELTISREVCLRWKHIIDGLGRSDSLWRTHCKTDFKTLYNVAKKKARAGTLWFHIYRSLTLWPKLAQAREYRDEFCPASGPAVEILNFEILRDGIIGVHTKSSIAYYNIETLELTNRAPIPGNYFKYTENENIIIVLSYQLHLFVIRKTIHNPMYETDATFDNVKFFLLVGETLYYVNLDDEIYVCYLDDRDLRYQRVACSSEEVVALGYAKHLHVLTLSRDIYTVYENEMRCTLHLDSERDLLSVLRRYNFLERMDWRIYTQWSLITQRSMPPGLFRDIETVRIYGDVIFVGSNSGVLRIYYEPDHQGQFDLLNYEPVKQYNFMERWDCPVLSTCPIIQIDVMESENGHTVLVGMPKKIAVLEFTHNFKRSASVAMLPYDDVQRAKVLRINEPAA